MGGYLCKRHKLLENAVYYMRANRTHEYALRFLALSWFVTIISVAICTEQTLVNLAGVDTEGCIDNSPYTIEQLPPWPLVERFPDYFCVIGYDFFVLVTSAAVLLIMPYEYTKFLTKAGGRTLTGYVFMQVQWNVTAFVTRCVAKWAGWHQDVNQLIESLPIQPSQRGVSLLASAAAYSPAPFELQKAIEKLQSPSTYNVPINATWFFFGVFPVCFCLFLCSETFEYIASPFVTPVYAALLLDPDTAAAAKEAAKEAKGSGGGGPKRFRFTLRWLFTFLAGAFLANAVAATNGFNF